MKKLAFLLLCMVSANAFSQTKNFIDQPYLETSSIVDTLVTPDRIYLEITISEKDTKGKISVEELENQMTKALTAQDINIEKQLSIADMASDFRKYLLQQKDIIKTKAYSLLVYDAAAAGKAIIALEKLGISNVEISKVEYSKIEELKLDLKFRAMVKAKKQGEKMLKPLNQKLGAAIYISDNNNEDRIVSSRNYDMQVVRKVSYNSIMDKNSSDIEFEKIKVESKIKVFFKIE